VREEKREAHTPNKSGERGTIYYILGSLKEGQNGAASLTDYSTTDSRSLSKRGLGTAREEAPDGPNGNGVT